MAREDTESRIGIPVDPGAEAPHQVGRHAESTDVARLVRELRPSLIAQGRTKPLPSAAPSGLAVTPHFRGSDRDIGSEDPE